MLRSAPAALRGGGPAPFLRGGYPMNQKDKIKLVVAIIVLIAAVALFGWNFGWFGGGGSPTPSVPTTPEGEPKGGPRIAPGSGPTG